MSTPSHFIRCSSVIVLAFLGAAACGESTGSGGADGSVGDGGGGGGGGGSTYQCSDAPLGCGGGSTITYQACFRASTQQCQYRFAGKTYACAGDCSNCAAAAEALIADACPEPTCTGSATPCSLRSSYSCLDGFGCSTGGSCSGSSWSCSSIYSSYSCSLQAGCSWSSATSKCTGYATSCFSLASSYSCESQGGCYWTDTCTGVATSCSSLSQNLCTAQPGCSVSY